jgi:hypothetical protein
MKHRVILQNDAILAIEKHAIMADMDDTKQMADQVFRQRVLRARAMSPEEKFAAGPRLFEYASEITLSGIRNQHPDADELEVRRIFSERLSLRERIEAEQLKQYLQEQGRES